MTENDEVHAIRSGWSNKEGCSNSDARIKVRKERRRFSKRKLKSGEVGRRLFLLTGIHCANDTHCSE